MELERKAIPNEYLSDHLFLLIGTNPLPNYVAAKLLTKEQATIYLLHSTATASVADRLARRLGMERSDLRLVRYSIMESDGPAIGRKVNEIVRPYLTKWSPAAVGLNFTGGTKPMAVYAALALRNTFPKAIFSYLDSRTLSMIVDAGGPIQSIRVGRSVALSLDELADLHGYRINSPAHQPRPLAIAQAIAQVHLAPEGMKQWRAWLETWRNGAKLPDLADFPTFSPALQAFQVACGGGAATEVGLAQALGFQALAQCGKYFVSGWLEDYTLDAVARIAADAQLNDYSSELLIRAPGRTDFDLDVAATLGYQLFSISCVVTEKKEPAKDHLLEVVTRAGQLGGEEARFAVVSFYNKPEDLENEVSQAWDAAGRIKVFGSRHIQELSQHLLKWIREANQEVL